MDVEACAIKIWEYMHMGHQLHKSDCILVLGSHDTRVAERGAALYLEGWAPVLLLSGCLGALTRGAWDRPEAEVFADIAVRMGVPEDRILIENRSTNTGENIRFSRQLLREKGIQTDRIIAVHKPYAERRAYATIKKVWPEVEVIAASPCLAFHEYPNGEISEKKMIHVMVGDLQRVMLYGEKGFQIHQEVPPDVVQAYETLVDAGFTGHLLKP